MDLKEFDYELPDSLIAAFPSRERDGLALVSDPPRHRRDHS